MRMRAPLAGIIAFAIGCGPAHHDPNDDDSKATLTIAPAASELVILNGAPTTQDYTATLTFPDGTQRDVTGDVQFSVDPTYAGFNANQLVAQAAGKTQVVGTYKDRQASAQLIIRVKGVRVDPSLPPDTADWFSGPEDGTLAPMVVYPPPDVVMPRNLGDFEVHWTDNHGNDVFEISLRTEFTDVRVYVPGGNGVPAAGQMPSWTAFSSAEWFAAVANEKSVQYQVRGTTIANHTSIGSATPQLVVLSNEEMLGGLYYWAATAANGPYGIFRHDMSKPGEPAEQYMTTAQTGNRCVACHVLSRDGTRMAITYDGGDGAATLLDVKTATPQPGAAAKWNFGTFTPDGEQFLSVSGGTLSVRNWADQSVIATMPASGWVTHPDLSPDGTRLVYVHPSQTGADWTFGGGQIFTRTYDQASHSFGPEQQLVADGGNNYYPSFSPDGKWILFNKAPSGDAYNNGNATLWVIKSDGSSQPIELAKADAGLGLTNSWGRWAPFAQSIGTGSEQLYWVTVSSKRNFGTRLVGANRPQIWMTPFFTTRAESGSDPSASSFRLPFQNIDSNNHIAQWTEQVVVP